MKELVILSGKGGTGKTSIVGSFAALSENAVFCDADVDAADLHLLLKPEVLERREFTGGGKAYIRNDDCTSCGTCISLCQWDAIDESFRVDPLTCEGCGVCASLCPEKAIDFPPAVCGEWYVSDTRFGPMVHARLGIAEENSGKLVTLVRTEAAKLAEKKSRELLITDGPPGIGCPVIASLGGATAVLIVTEPTVSGRHDLQRVAELARHFSVPAFLVINKSDLNPPMCSEIRTMAAKLEVETLAEIPFDKSFTMAMVQGKTVVEEEDCPSAARVGNLWEQVRKRLDKLP
jgi:MinD superfamily P-loop ATPase